MKTVKEIIQVTEWEAVEIMKAVKGHPFSYWAAFTEPTLVGGKKSYERFGGMVYKYATYTLVQNRVYDRAIEIACEKAGLDFSNWKPEPHRYAIHLSGNIMYHKDDAHMAEKDRRLYAQFMLHKGCQNEATYFDSELRKIDNEIIKPFLPIKTSKKQDDLGLSDSEKIPCINYSIGSIKLFTANGQKYEIVGK
jgi:hypothetical protein